MGYKQSLLDLIGRLKASVEAEDWANALLETRRLYNEIQQHYFKKEGE